MSGSLETRLVARFRSLANASLGGARIPGRGQSLRAIMQGVADAAVVRPLGYVAKRLGYRQDVITRVKFLAAEESARYVLEEMMPCAIFDDRYPLFDLAVRQSNPSGLMLEFGVFNGRSINYIAQRIGDRTIFGFDSFEGLAEDWGGTSLLRGGFDLRGRLPKTLANVTLIKGWFDQTLPSFLEEHDGTIAFLHLDADTYESTKFVLEQISARLIPGTVLQFDEYLGYPGWQSGERLAWATLCKQRGITYRYLGVGWMSVAVQIESIGGRT